MLALVATLQTIGPLKAHVIDAPKSERIERVVVIMHGYGASGDDFVPIAQALPLTPGTRYVFPEAPIELDGSGRAWWIIDWVERSRYERKQDLDGYFALVPPGLEQASAKVSAMLDHIEQQWGVPHDRIVLGGFSQGAMLTLDVAAQRTKKPRALVLLSGTLCATPRWRPKEASLAGVPIFQSHGKADAVLPYFAAERMRDELTKAGAKLEWLSFSGGHTVPPQVIAALHRFLEVTVWK